MRVSKKVQKNSDKKHVLRTEVTYEIAEQICITHLELIKQDLEHYLKGKVLVFVEDSAADKKLLKKKIDEINGIIEYLTQ
jgi:hypothetical protein